MNRVGALVMNSSGILSYRAILTREYRVPAVVSTGNAMSLLMDEQDVIVDGNNGRMVIQGVESFAIRSE